MIYLLILKVNMNELFFRLVEYALNENTYTTIGYLRVVLFLLHINYEVLINTIHLSMTTQLSLRSFSKK